MDYWLIAYCIVVTNTGFLLIVNGIVDTDVVYWLIVDKIVDMVMDNIGLWLIIDCIGLLDHYY